MVVVRKSREKTEDGRWIVESYHQRAEILTDEQCDGSIEVPEIPAKPERPGYKYRLVIDDSDQLGWFEIKVDTQEKELLMRMVNQGKIKLDDIDDEEVKEELRGRV